MPIRIAFLDCDGTLTRVKSSWEYLHRRLGLWENNADNYQRLFREGKIDYHEFCKKDALLWRGLPVSDVMGVMAEIPYQADARETVEALKDMGLITIIISTGLSFLVEKVKKDLGIHVALSNELATKNSYLTGGIRINVEHNKKGQIVEKMLKTTQTSREEACAIGDGDGDLGMFKAVGLSMGLRPRPNRLPHVGCALYVRSLFHAVEIVRGYR